MKSLFGQWDFHADVLLMLLPVVCVVLYITHVWWLAAPAFVSLPIILPFGAVASFDICRRHRKEMLPVAALLFIMYVLVIAGTCGLCVLLITEN